MNLPGNLLIAPLRSVGPSILQSFQHQQVALSVAKQQVSISTTGGVQETFNGLTRQKAAWLHIRSLIRFHNSLSCRVFATEAVLPSAGGQGQQCHPWSFAPKPRLPAGSADPGSAGSWRALEEWHEGAAPSL